jgi:hypothetical protein
MLRPYAEPCKEYLNTLKKGIKQNWPDMSDEEIDNYLDSCDRTKSSSSKEEEDCE